MRPIVLVVSFVLSALLAGCSNSSESVAPINGTFPTTPPPSPTASPSAVALLRVVAGSPSRASVLVCVDQQQLGGSTTIATLAYGAIAPLQLVAGGVSHVITVYTSATAAGAATCAVAPGAYMGVSPLATATFTFAVKSRTTIVFARPSSATVDGLYPFSEPTYSTVPTSPAVISHNVLGGPITFGYQLTQGGALVALGGATSVAGPTTAGPNPVIVSPISGPPALFDILVPSGSTYASIGSATAIAPVSGQPYVVALYAIDTGDAPTYAQVVETTSGYGF